MAPLNLGKTAVMLFGAPGSGKGTLAKHLVHCCQAPHISTGDMFREHVQAGDALGREVQATMEAGRLVSDELVNRIVRERLSRPDCSGGFILDGYPRTQPQAETLMSLLGELGFRPLVVHLVVDYNRIVTRLAARRSCPVCGKVYNLVSMPPQRPGLCDADNAALVEREDDREEVIWKRLRAYDEQTRPVLQYFTARNIAVYEVDGNEGAPEEVADRACKLLGKE